jgi:polyhydroxyalkanoate synthase
LTSTSQRDPAEIGQVLLALAERAARALLAREADDELRIPDPDIVRNAFAALAEALRAEPERLRQAQAELARQLEALSFYVQRRAAGEAVPPLIAPSPGDRRFKDPAWREEIGYDGLKQAYLLATRWLEEIVAGTPGLEPAMRRKVLFYTRQLVDALAPTNAPLLNPAVLRRAAETGGESLRLGLERLVADLERGRGELGVETTRAGAFALGRDLAVTPGKVVFENELMQLVQYAPATRKVYKRPLLVVPPWINKFYVLDLRPENSLVRWAVAQGFTVFLISWVNPGPELGHKRFEDYLAEGPLAALEAIERAVGEREVNALGYCLGGTLTACLLAWLAARGQSERVRAATLLATMTDFAEPGELGVFIDDEQLAILERHMARKGCLEARHMQRVFSLLRANDLIWDFVVSNYLLGREPPAFDLLHWNADGTRMPAAMQSFYLREFYQRNRLAEPGGIALLGVPIDLGRISTPCYILAMRDDHIAPWVSVYRGARRLGGPVRFVLGGSGHVAGVINPPAAGRYGYRLNRRRPADPARWLARAEPRTGSWWPDWRAWLGRRSGPKVPARDPARGGLPPIEEAPGRYVKVRADER